MCAEAVEAMTALPSPVTSQRYTLSQICRVFTEPPRNGVSERFIPTLKDQLLWLRSFETIGALNEALSALKAHYNSA